MSVKIFGREPAAVVGLIEALLALVLAFNLVGELSPERVAAIVAAVTAALGFYTAYVTEDTVLGATVGLVKAVLTLAVGFGLALTTEQTGALIALVTVMTGLFQRTQTSPLAEPTWREGGGFAPTTPHARQPLASAGGLGSQSGDKDVGLSRR